MYIYIYKYLTNWQPGTKLGKAYSNHIPRHCSHSFYLWGLAPHTHTHTRRVSKTIGFNILMLFV